MHKICKTGRVAESVLFGVFNTLIYIVLVVGYER